MFGALAYNQNKVDSEEAKVLFSNKMLLSENGNFSIGECMRSFEMQMPVQLSTKKPILHISINPHPEDVLTDQQLSDIAKEYMRKLGYGDQPYLVYKHTDIDRHHIHIVGLRVDESGRPYQGIVYSATNDKGEKEGNPVKASRIGKSVGYEAVQRRMEKSGEAIRNGKLKERTRKIVTTAMRTTRNRRELERELKKQGIDVVFRQNDSGRIYGVTFIDHDSRVVLNGSRLGKEYSANVFNDLYSDERKTDIRQEQSTHQEQPDFTPKADLISGVASVVSAFGGLLGGTSGGDEPQDTARQKRKKKKKRTRRID